MASDEQHPGVCIVYSGEPLTVEEQGEFLSDAACEARWSAGVPINELDDKRGRPPKRPAKRP